MLHSLKTPAILAACLLTAAACSSGAPSSQSGAASAQNAAPALKASPVDLAVLAALSGTLDTPRVAATTVTTDGPTVVIRGASQIVPAKTSTFQADSLIEGDIDAEFEQDILPVVDPDSDLLQGTVYYGTSFSAPPKKRIVPGTWRTYEYKK